jgi:hypothetical protein
MKLMTVTLRWTLGFVCCCRCSAGVWQSVVAQAGPSGWDKGTGRALTSLLQTVGIPHKAAILQHGLALG